MLRRPRRRPHCLAAAALALVFTLLTLAPTAVALESTSSGQVAALLHSHDSFLHGSLAMQHPFMTESAATAQGADSVPVSRDESTRRRPRLRIGTLNIRYDVHSRHPLLKPATDLLQRKWGEQRWPRRRDQLVDQVLFHDLDVVGFQEVLHHQLQDLAQLMGDDAGQDVDDGWAHVGVGRDDGKHAGEAVPIFYRPSRLEFVSVSHRWLSPTPLEPGSKGWDAGQPRMITFAHFRDLALSDSRIVSSQDKTDLIVANTHWDDRGLRAREESARLIRRLVEEEIQQAHARAQMGGEANRGEPLVVLLGDLNSPADEAGYQVLTGRRYLQSSVPDNQIESRGANAPDSSTTTPRSFFDARHELVRRGAAVGGSAQVGGGAMSRRFGPLNTYTGFEPSDTPKVIDFVLPFANSAFSPALLSPPAFAPTSSATASLVLERTRQWRVTRYGVVQNFFEDVGGRRAGHGDDEDTARDAMILSDHRLVVVGFELS
ncbi:hypothetical protein JCM3774_006883 [Rhodotorula dairenensis]